VPIIKNDDEILVSGINIQAPWSNLILSGIKTVETRSYPVPRKYIGKWIALIETSGKTRPSFKARIVGLIKIVESYQYNDRLEWIGDYDSHRVKQDDLLFGFRNDRRKFGWKIIGAITLKESIKPPKSRGIVFATSCQIPKRMFSDRDLIIVSS
jgi:hypothetical protein